MTDQSEERRVAKAWDGNAQAWAEDVRAGHDKYREIYTWPAFRAFLPEIASLEILDLGCGEGENTRRLARDGAQMTGIDLSAKMISHGRAAEASDPLGIAYDIGSFSDLAPYTDGLFDGCISTMALMDGPNLSGTMQAAHRVLRPGGWLAFSVLHPCFMMTLIRWSSNEYGQETHLEIGDYFADTKSDERWRFSKAQRDGTGVGPLFHVPRFAHRLEDYLNALAEAGFRIERVSEPRPSQQAADAYPWLRRFRRHAPIALMVLARRPAP